MQLTKELFVPLPNVVDKELNPVKVSLISLPSFIILDEALGQIVIRPSNPGTDLGIFNGKISLSDSNLEEKYPFKVEVINKPPFLTSSLKDQKVFLGNP
jgi:hypothetical protein